ncbi:MAG: hypothetical protein V4479_07575 [Actinomycetota bacterium]
MPNRKLGSIAPIAFTTHDSTDAAIDASALTFAVRVVKPNGTSAAGGGTGGISHGITQPDVTNALGSCYYTPAATDFTVLGSHILRISASGMALREVLVEVEADAPLIATVVSGSLTAASFPVTFASEGVAVSIPTGQLANEAHFRFAGNVTPALTGQVQKITGFAGGVLSFTTAFSTAPAAGDIGVIVNG